ncbi:MAG TPA: hypothetical protein VF503_14685 [Sphingobium sp.]|uniref:hypothetical protein n=1 Tax=Sphingobium sp. TaxID=1912891 RepID=UPI002ED2ECE1
MYFPQIGLPAERGRSGHALAVLQMVFVLCVVVALIAAPPASGRMLLIPLGGEGRDGLARMAIDAGARLVAPGPLGGSLVVSGEGAALIVALMPRHVLVLSASIGGCGEGTVRP